MVVLFSGVNMSLQLPAAKFITLHELVTRHNNTPANDDIQKLFYLQKINDELYHLEMDADLFNWMYLDAENGWLSHLTHFGIEPDASFFLKEMQFAKAVAQKTSNKPNPEKSKSAYDLMQKKDRLLTESEFNDANRNQFISISCDLAHLALTDKKLKEKINKHVKVLEETLEKRNFIKGIQENNGETTVFKTKELGAQTNNKNYILTILKYESCLMTDDIKLEKNKLYLRKLNGKIAYSVITPNGSEVKDIIIDKMPTPEPFTLESLKKIKKDILAATIRKGHTKEHYVIRLQDSHDSHLFIEKYLHSHEVSKYFIEDYAVFFMPFKISESNKEFRPVIFSQFANQGNLYQLAERLRKYDAALLPDADYDLDLMNKDERKEGVFYLKETKKGLKLQVISSEDELITETIPWQMLADFPQDAAEIVNSKERYLPKLLEMALPRETFFFKSTKDGLAYHLINPKGTLVTHLIPWAQLPDAPKNAKQLIESKDKYLPQIMAIAAQKDHCPEKKGESPETIASKAASYFTLLSDFCSLLIDAKAYHPDIKLTNFLVNGELIRVSDRKTLIKNANPGVAEIATTRAYAPAEYTKCVNYRTGTIKPEHHKAQFNMPQFMAYELGMALKEFLILSQTPNVPDIEEFQDYECTAASYFINPPKQIINLSLLVQELTRPDPEKRMTIEQFKTVLIEKAYSRSTENFYKRIEEILPAASIGLQPEIDQINRLLTNEMTVQELQKQANQIFEALSTRDPQEIRLLKHAELLATKCFKEYASPYFKKCSKALEAILLQADWDKAPWYRKALHWISRGYFRVERVANLENTAINLGAILNTDEFKPYLPLIEFLPSKELKQLGIPESMNFEDFIFIHEEEIREEINAKAKKKELGINPDQHITDKKKPGENKDEPEEDSEDNDTTIIRKNDEQEEDSEDNGTTIIRKNDEQEEDSEEDSEDNGTTIIRKNDAQKEDSEEDSEDNGTTIIRKNDSKKDSKDNVPIEKIRHAKALERTAGYKTTLMRGDRSRLFSGDVSNRPNLMRSNSKLKIAENESISLGPK